MATIDTSDTAKYIGQQVLVNYHHTAIVRFWGKVHFANGDWVGVEFVEPNLGQHDGMVQDVRYFQAKANSATFVRPQQVMIYSEQEKAASAVQKASRKLLAKRRALKERTSTVWNKLDNYNENLTIRRSKQMSGLFPTAPRHQAKLLDLLATTVEEGYHGPVISENPSLSDVLETLEAFKEGRSLHIKYAAQILIQAHSIISNAATLQEIAIANDERLTMVGDLHGQLQDLFSIFSMNGIPSATNKYLFNGDFVDRGDCGCEVLYSILLFKILYPEAVFLNRGNHESRQQNRVMGFEEEVTRKHPGPNGKILFNAFSNFFDQLPLAALVQQKIFVVHGGLFWQDGVTLEHIRSIDRRREPPLHKEEFQDQIFESMLWSDPRKTPGRQLSARGAGVEFGKEVTFEFLKTNRVALIVRSHECVQEGFELLHDGRLITLFSASYYCGVQVNKGAFLCVGPDLQPEIQQFYAGSLSDATWEVPESLQNKRLDDENVKLIIERLVDKKHSLLWQFNICDTKNSGCISRLDWAQSLRLVLELDIPFLLYQSRLADLEENGTINYSKFLDRYRVELTTNSAATMARWQDAVINKICQKMFVALGSGDVDEAFRRFDSDHNGYIEYDELVDTLQSLGIKLTEPQLYELMTGLDKNRDSKIDSKEFASRFQIVFDRLAQSSGDEPSTSWKNVSLLAIGKGLCRRKGSIDGAFREMDATNAGKITYEQFQEVVWELEEVKLNREQMQELTYAMDLDNDGFIDYIEFATAFKFEDAINDNYRRLGADGPVESDEAVGWQERVIQQIANFFYQNRSELSSLFRSFDSDNDGFIDKHEFREGCMKLNTLLQRPITEDDIDAIMNALDANGDGKLSYTEFIDGFRVVDTVHPLEESFKDLPPGGGLSETFAAGRRALTQPASPSMPSTRWLTCRHCSHQYVSFEYTRKKTIYL